MDRVYQSNAIETPPSTVASSGSYPTAGNKASGQLATVPGPYWFYSITEEIRNAIIAAGLTPDPSQVNQLATAMAKFLPLSGGTMTGAVTFNVADGHICKSDTAGRMVVRGGTKYDDGASLYLNGSSRSSNTSWFELTCHDGTNSKSLTGKPDGALTWGGKGIELVNAYSISSDNGYIRYESGLQICWGYVSSVSATAKTVTFPMAFYAAPGVSGVVGAPHSLGIYTVNNTSFVVRIGDSSTALRYVAIGKWK